MSNRSEILPSITIIGASAVAAAVYSKCFPGLPLNDDTEINKKETAKEKIPLKRTTPNEGNDEVKNSDEEKILGLDDDEGSLKLVKKARAARKKIPIWLRMDDVDEPKDVDEAPHKIRIFYRRKEGILSTPLFLPRKFDDSSLLSRAMDETLYQQFARKSTNLGSTLETCIRPGLDNPVTEEIKRCGVVACDADCYSVFRPLFIKIAELQHPKYTKEVQKVRHNFNLNKLLRVELPAFDTTKVVRLEMEIHRNLSRYKFPPAIDRLSRRKTLKIVSAVLLSCCNNCDSKVYDLTTLSNVDHEKLRNRKLLPDCPNTPYDISAGILRDWPDGRAVWMCEKEGMSAIINVVDHLVLIGSVENGKLDELAKKMSAFYGRVTKRLLEENEEISTDKIGAFGCLTSFPELLGPALVFRAEIRWKSVSPSLELLSAVRSALDGNGLVLKSLSVDGNSSSAILTVESSYNLGYSEFEALDIFRNGIERFLQMEQ